MSFYGMGYIFVLIGALISGIAALNVKSTFNKYSKVGSASRMTGADVARKMLHDAGIYDVTVQQISGSLTDHYSPKDRALRLSEPVYSSTSIAAIGVAAHECGHAIQDELGYMPLKLRSVSVPVANIGSKLSWPILVLGVALGFPELAEIGVWCFLFVVLFQLITLPVEFNASHRALEIIGNNGVLGTSEVNIARKVLTAAALTYVAALFSSILQLVRMVLLSKSGRRRR